MSWVGPTSLEHTTSAPVFTLHAPPCHPGSPQASAVFPGTLTTPCFFRVDVAHLVLYHLSVCCKKKYFDFDREILPFTSENWDSLLLGEVRGRKLGVHTGAHGEMEEKWKRGRGICVPLTLLSFPFLSSQTPQRENDLRSSSRLSTATKTGE